MATEELKLRSERVIALTMTGEKREYDVCEFAGDDDEAFFDEGRENAELTVAEDGKTKVRLKTYRGIRIRLLKRTVRKDGVLVPEEELKQLVARSQRDLYEVAQRVCGLGNSAEEDAKNG